MTDSPPQIYERDYYQRLYDIEENHWWARGMRDIMFALLNPRLGQRHDLQLFDAGCGTGLLLNLLTQYDLAEPVAGIDISAHALAFCRQRGAERLALASAVYPPFAAQSFDLIICIDTLQHLSPAGADQIALDAFARLLKPGGLLYLRTNSALGHAPLRGVDPNLYRRYRKSELAALVTARGLHVERASYVNMLPSFWGMLREYMTARKRTERAIGPGLAIRPGGNPLVNKSLHAILRVEAWLIGRLGIELPFGHSLALLARKQ